MTGRPRRLRHEARACAAALAENFWLACFRLPRLARPVPVCDPAGAGCVLVVAPHPDDEVIGCGGTILRHVVAGDRVHLVYVTDGRSSRSVRIPPEHVARLRRHEAGLAAAALGVADWHWLGFPEGSWSLGDGARALRTLLEDTAPALIYAPSSVDYHPEHVQTAAALASALSAPGDPAPRLRIYEVQVPLTTVLANRVVDISGSGTAYQAALAAHASQAYTIARSARLRRYAGASCGLRGQAEPFWEMPAAAYVRRFGPTAPRPGSYRGLRHEPWADGLAYVVGRGARAALRET